MDKLAIKNQILKTAQERGLSVSETAAMFNKIAAEMSVVADTLVSDVHRRASGHTKTAILDQIISIGSLLAGGAAAAGYVGGSALGRHVADNYAPELEYDLNDLQKIDQSMRVRQEAAEILKRVDSRKKQLADGQIPSSRKLF